MVQTLFIAASPSRCESFEKAFSFIDDWNLASANSIISALDHLFTKAVDIIMLDLEAPIRGLKQLLKVIKLKFPQKYRIVIRCPRFKVHHRYFLEQAHSSFQEPENVSEMRNLVRRINVFFPVDTPKTTTLIPEITEEEKVSEEYASLYRDLCERECSYSYVMEKAVSNRELSKLILKRINSPHYGLYKTVKSVGRAIKLMGNEGVKSVLEDRFGAALLDELMPLRQAG